MRLTPETVRIVRQNLGLTQAQLAKRLGVSQGYVGLIERGERPVTRQNEIDLREAFGIDDEAIQALLEANLRLKQAT